ncbi:hypothetical protein STEG23_007335, partial [Scotinomys teguina]
RSECGGLHQLNTVHYCRMCPSPSQYGTPVCVFDGMRSFLRCWVRTETKLPFPACEKSKRKRVNLDHMVRQSAGIKILGSMNSPRKQFETWCMQDYQGEWRENYVERNNEEKPLIVVDPVC